MVWGTSPLALLVIGLPARADEVIGWQHRSDVCPKQAHLSEIMMLKGQTSVPLGIVAGGWDVV